MVRIHTTAAARRYGHDPDQLHRRAARGELIRLRPGAFLDSGGEEIAPDVRHAALILTTAPHLGPRTVVSHWSAAVLHGLPVPSKLLQRVSVVRPLTGSGSDSPTVHSRAARLLPHEITFRYGVPVTSLRRTMRDLSIALEPVDAVVAADAAMRLGFGRDEFDCAPGYAVRKREFVRDFADPLAESPLESRSRFALHHLGFPPPELQMQVFDGRGRFLARADMLWREHRVVGEADGRAKTGLRLAEGADAAELIEQAHQRDREYRDVGLLAVHWNWAATLDLARLDEAVSSAFREAPRHRPLRAEFVQGAVRPLKPADYGDLADQAMDQRRFVG